MRRGLFIFMAWICVVGIQAQSDFSFILNKEGKIIVLPKNKTYELNIPKASYKTFTPAGTRDIDIKLREFTPDIPHTSLQERPMDMQISSAAYQPFFNVYTPMTIMNGGISWHSGNWSLYGGGFGGRFFSPFNPSPGITAGANVQVEYQPTDWLKLKGWGQYAYYADEYNNPHMLRNPFFYHTKVGGSMEFKVTDNFWMGAGINYEYNPVRRKMEPQFLVYPVFKSGRFKIGM